MLEQIKKGFFLKQWFFKHLKDLQNPLNQKSSFTKKELKHIADAS